MREPVDAELPVARLDRIAPGVDPHEIGVVDAGAGQGLGEVEAGARARRLEVDLPVEHPEAVEPLGARHRGGDRRPRRQHFGEPERVERRPALARRLQRHAGQPRGLAGLRIGAGPQEGVDPGRDREVAQSLARSSAPVA